MGYPNTTSQLQSEHFRKPGTSYLHLARQRQFIISRCSHIHH